MATVIVYFSKSNNTRTGAKELARRLEAETVELTEVRPGSVLGALMNGRSRLRDEPWKQIEGADTVYLLSPIWASHGVPAMNAFVKKADFTGKKVFIVTFQADEKLSNSDKVHGRTAGTVKARGGTVAHCCGLVGGVGMNVFAGEQAIEAQIDKLMAQTAHEG